MARILPSQVVGVIDRMFPFAKGQPEDPKAFEDIQWRQSQELSSIIQLLDQVPNELLALEEGDNLALVCARAAIVDMIETWRSASDRVRLTALRNIDGFGNLSPVTLIRRALVKCPDHVVPQGTEGLDFMTDAADGELRDDLGRDIGAVIRALADSQWKVATVLAGSVAEALLLWGLTRHNAEFPGGTDQAVLGIPSLDLRPGEPPMDALLRWGIRQYVEIERRLNPRMTENETTDLLTKMQDFRNLVHQGRQLRLKDKPDLGMAYIVRGTLARLLRDLDRRFH